MIGLPVNDYPCLSQVAELVSDLVRDRDPVLVELAQRYRTIDALIAWIRSLPQRDDNADPSDGPRADHCTPPQRLRIPAPDPNCVERAALYLAVAEMIDPRPLRQLATIQIPAGRHTFLVESGTPVVLDPSVPQNALEAGMFHIEGTSPTLSPEEQIDWICSIAEEPARHYRSGVVRVRAARDAMRAALLGRPIPRVRVVDLAFTLALAEREASLFGPRGVAVHRSVINAVTAAEMAGSSRPAPSTRPPTTTADPATARNGVELRVGRHKIRPASLATLGSIARASSRVGARVVAAGAESALGRVGITPALLAEVERELNREGLSLGPLTRSTPADRLLFASLATLV